LHDADAVDDALGDPEDDEEGDRIFREVMDEIGIDLNQMVGNAPSTSLEAQATPMAEGAKQPAAAASSAGGGDADAGTHVVADCTHSTHAWSLYAELLERMRNLRK
jgi:division protein CdvB (Snf7/Vps24/ESCRT-III family)